MGTLLTTDIRKEKIDYRDALNLKIHMLRTPVLNSCPAVGSSSWFLNQSEIMIWYVLNSRVPMENWLKIVATMYVGAL